MNPDIAGTDFRNEITRSFSIKSGATRWEHEQHPSLAEARNKKVTRSFLNFVQVILYLINEAVDFYDKNSFTIPTPLLMPRTTTALLARVIHFEYNRCRVPHTM